MATSLVFEKGPHQKTRHSTQWKMNQFGLCLLILYAVAVIFYYVQGAGSLNSDNTPVIANYVYGNRALILGAASILAGLLSDIVYHFPQLFKAENKGHRLGTYFSKIYHSYSYITSLILVLLLPIGAEWWQVAICSAFATFVCKDLFGGFGSNIVNPAIAGRVLAQLVFTSSMTTYIEGAGGESIVTGASITTLVSTSGFESLYDISLWNMFIGNYYGALGETFAIVIVICAVYLIARGIIDWRVTLFYIGSIYIASLVMFVGLGWGNYSWEAAFRYVLMGGVMFGGVFCLTDPVTTPTSRSGKIMFALGCAILTLVFRLFTNSPEGVAYSILLMNFLTPLIDRLIVGRTNRHSWIQLLVILVLFIGVLCVGLCYGYTHEASLPASLTAASSARRIC